MTKAVEAAEGDFDLAIKLTSLQATFGSGRVDVKAIQGSQFDLPWTGESGGLFDEEWLDTWAMILLYLVHRMTDFAYQTFPPSKNETKDCYEGWHKAVKAVD